MKEDIKLHLVRLGSDVQPDIDYGGYNSCGIIGEPTGHKDVNEEDIHIGDMLKLTKPCGSWWSNLVVKTEDVNQREYYTVMGSASFDLETLLKERKGEVVMHFKFIDAEYRRHIHFIALSEKYLDISWDFIDGVWTKVK